MRVPQSGAQRYKCSRIGAFIKGRAAQLKARPGQSEG